MNLAGGLSLSSKFFHQVGLQGEKRELTDELRRSLASSLQDACTEIIGSLIEHCRKREGIQSVCLAGGLFQNALLVANLERRLGINDIDQFEVNEAFAPVPLAWLHDLRADPERLNPRGGAIALGHPLGASGARLMCSLLNGLEETGGRFGLQTMCEAGGQANATIIERM